MNPGKPNEHVGNIWDEKAQAKVVTTNGIVKPNGELVMGAGIAKQVADLWPSLPGILGHRVREYGNQVYVVRLDTFSPRFNCWYMIAMPTKEHYTEKSTLAKVEQSCIELRRVANILGLENVVLPRPGCGLGGLDWKQVRPICHEILDERFTIISLTPDADHYEERAC